MLPVSFIKEENTQQQAILTARFEALLKPSDAMHVFHRGVQDGQSIELPQLNNMPEKTTERLLGKYEMAG